MIHTRSVSVSLPRRLTALLAVLCLGLSSVEVLPMHIRDASVSPPSPP